jgi:FkbH-like protein
MRAEIAGLSKAYLDRIVQLTNKSNQFNLTTRRYTIPEMEAVMNGDNHIGIYGKLMDKFGDNGLVSVVVGERDNQALHIILWLMSCRVLQRTLERAMLDELVERSRAQGVSTIYGYYFPTSKNNLVANHYQELGFEPHLSERRDLPQDSTAWVLNLRNYSKINRHIKVFDRAYA